MLTDLIETVLNLGFSLVGALLNVLPVSFVRQQLENLGAMPFLSYVNWFIPFNEMKPVMGVWLSCCTACIIAYLISKNTKS
ncbi:MAG: hypothetical protein PHG16_07040 [Lachnospiraceae bacterium]|nr:hypothetical protein [Lachnospiraceae bacterium]